MKIKTETLIEDLKKRTKKCLSETEKLKQIPSPTLNWKEGPEIWSVLECLEHLNLYGDFYLPEIEKRMKSSQSTIAAPFFKSSFIGNYFAEAMLPKEKLNKMKTFKDKNPSGSALTVATIDKFIDQQRSMLELLTDAEKVNLNKVKTAISITKLLKLRLGDTFRVVIYHNQRHMVQIERILARQ